MNNFKPYPKYKDSGVKWLGEVPEHWSSDRLRNSFKFRKGLTITKENLQIEGIPTINYGEVHSKFGFRVSPEEHELKCVAFDYLEKDPKALLIKDDFIFADTSEDLEGSGNFSRYDSETKAFAGYHTIIARNHSLHSSEFLAYLFDSPSFRYQVRCSMKGVKVYSITQSILKDLGLLLPPKSEQIAIANFLDEKVGQIDAAIAQKERLIELLNERKQIIIQNAVTKGLNPKAPMRDSGIEWIGEIPEHWEVVPGLEVFSEGKAMNPKSGKEEILSLSYGEIIIKDKSKLTGLVPESFDTYQYIEPGNIIVRCMDLQNDKTSFRFGISKHRGIITSAYLNLVTTSKVSPPYVYYYLHFLDLTKVIYKLGSGLRQNLSYLDFKRLNILLPPLVEQETIVTYIKGLSTKINTAINQANSSIVKLKEYKATLINSAVTGKIMVNG
jgi:type I restriction enzyme S subunit